MIYLIQRETTRIHLSLFVHRITFQSIFSTEMSNFHQCVRKINNPKRSELDYQPAYSPLYRMQTRCLLSLKTKKGKIFESFFCREFDIAFVVIGRYEHRRTQQQSRPVQGKIVPPPGTIYLSILANLCLNIVKTYSSPVL